MIPAPHARKAKRESQQIHLQRPNPSQLPVLATPSQHPTRNTPRASKYTRMLRHTLSQRHALATPETVSDKSQNRPSRTDIHDRYSPTTPSDTRIQTTSRNTVHLLRLCHTPHVATMLHASTPNPARKVMQRCYARCVSER